MGSKAGKQKGDPQPTEAPEHAGGFSEGLGRLFKPNNKERKCKACASLLKITYVVLGIATVLAALGLLAVSVITAFATKIFTNEQSGRLVAMILLAFTAAASLTATIYSSISVCRKKGGYKSLVTSSLVLLLLALIQAIIGGVALRVTVQDEYDVTRSMKDSFQLAYVHKSVKYEKIWTTVQYELECCGINSPEDYRDKSSFYEVPNVSVACCPNYDPSRSLSSQENSREHCKIRGSYYNVGCQHLIIQLLKGTSASVLSADILLIILEVTGAALVLIISRRKKKDKEEEAKQPIDANNAPPAASTAKV